jgi:hypothetical protein
MRRFSDLKLESRALFHKRLLHLFAMQHQRMSFPQRRRPGSQNRAMQQPHVPLLRVQV